MLQRLGHRHVQHLRYVRALPLYLQRLAVVARPVAHLARNRYVRQKLHLDIDMPIPRTRLAPAPLHVEREPPRLVPSSARLRHSGEQFPDGRERPRVCSRIRARRPANRRLVYVHNLVYVLDSRNRIAVPRTLSRSVESLRQLLVQDFVDERALPRTRHARYANELTQRYLHVNVPQVVLSRPLDSDGLADALPPLFGNRYLPEAAQILPRQRFRLVDDGLHRPRRHHVAAMLARARPQVNYVVRRPHYRLVMLHDEHRVPQVAQVLERLDKTVVVRRMQTDGRLVAHVQHPHQPGAYLRRQPDALRLAPAQRGRRAR